MSGVFNVVGILSSSSRALQIQDKQNAFTRPSFFAFTRHSTNVPHLSLLGFPRTVSHVSAFRGKSTFHAAEGCDTFKKANIEVARGPTGCVVGEV